MKRLAQVALMMVGLVGASERVGAEVSLQARGLLDLCFATGQQVHGRNLTTFGDSNFEPYCLRLFLDASVADGLDVYVQTLLAEGYGGVRADGAYAMWSPWKSRDLHLEAGKIPWPIGTWAARKYSDKNPLVGEPLMYQHHASLPWNLVPADVNELVSFAGMGQASIEGGDWVGMPVVDDRWWDAGIVALGSARRFEFAAGVTQGAPGWPEPGTEDTPGQSVLGRVGIVPTPAVRLGLSGSYGPWLPEFFEYALRPGSRLADFHEMLAMADVELQRGRVELRGEAFTKSWDTITTGTLRLHGGYLETRIGVGALTWIAGRAEMMRFSEVTPTTGPSRPWDDPLDRYEIGAGVRATREVHLKLSAQRDVMRPPGKPTVNADALALAASIRF
ncbi:MAG: hypothetical protein ABIU54_11900 [Candidatus Eisenbacteria bacterium]